MQRKPFLLVLAALALVSAPLFGASPFGSFGGLVNGGNAGAGVLPIHGWALDDNGVAWVDILVDGKVVGRAEYGRERPGVTNNHPGFPNSSAPGFAYELNSTRHLNGLHAVSARVHSTTGEIVNLNTIFIEFLNLTHNLVPFGKIEFPNRDATLFGSCDPADSPRRYSVVTGYALDVGVETHDAGVGYVELLIDGAIHRNTVTGCHFDPVKGGYSDCYGLLRLDLSQFFDDDLITDPPLVGYRFVLDVGQILSSGYAPGHHTLTIRSGDLSGQVADIDEFSVFLTCDDFIGNQGSFGQIQRPRRGLTYGGSAELVGWALDWEGVHDVLVYLDGVLLGNAEYGFSRPAVTNLYPGFVDSLLPGWRFIIDTTQLSNSPHQIQVQVRDNLGQLTFIGERTFVVFNP